MGKKLWPKGLSFFFNLYQLVAGQEPSKPECKIQAFADLMVPVGAWRKARSKLTSSPVRTGHF